MIKIILKKKKFKKAKWLSEEALQIAEKRREAKGKGKKERHTHLNAEFHVNVAYQHMRLGCGCEKYKLYKEEGM